MKTTMWLLGRLQIEPAIFLSSCDATNKICRYRIQPLNIFFGNVPPNNLNRNNKAMSLLKRTRLRLKEKLFPVNIPYLTQSKYIIRTKNNFFFFYRITIYIFCQSTLYYTRIVSDFLGKIARQFRGQARRNPNNLTFEKIRPPLGQLSALSDLLRGTKNGIKKFLYRRNFNLRPNRRFTGKFLF